MINEIDRMKLLADSLEKEDRRALVIQIEGDEIRDANAIVVKALRAFILADVGAPTTTKS